MSLNTAEARSRRSADAGGPSLLASILVNRFADFGRCGMQLRDHSVGQRRRQGNDLVVDECGVIRRRGRAIEVILGQSIGKLRLQVCPRVLALVVYESVA